MLTVENPVLSVKINQFAYPSRSESDLRPMYPNSITSVKDSGAVSLISFFCNNISENKGGVGAQPPPIRGGMINQISEGLVSVNG